MSPLGCNPTPILPLGRDKGAEKFMAMCKQLYGGGNMTLLKEKELTEQNQKAQDLISQLLSGQRLDNKQLITEPQGHVQSKAA